MLQGKNRHLRKNRKTIAKSIRQELSNLSIEELYAIQSEIAEASRHDGGRFADIDHGNAVAAEIMERLCQDK